ncbi:MAG TPA: DUF3667 domain-containing protein [Ginsengibacter sp.]|nr:DUF3667 domain-containing protein [Chitinophagaceae bacterium]MCO5287734.1 DUF3667 domain-containing protein [Chitinophagaceae bacterium]MCZ2395403.1 DUF3667 domain-containing protein [Chitinophagales bacterium]HRP16805.1 DUF3667 domain-containing protein [Ginsengibacter sp.]HRP44930.1 DUF3667 domain-containing protein [Ginsengibacter sp.]
MPHHLRKENNCLNCGATVNGRYCSNCGQENKEPREGFWHLAVDFVFDLFHFDGKFFSSLRYLLFRPGFLTREYMAGRRTKYLHPVRMYIFTSAIFFLIYFSFVRGHEKVNEARFNAIAAETIKKSLQDSLAGVNDSLNRSRIMSVLGGIDSVFQLESAGSVRDEGIRSIGTRARTVEEYDSLQKLLPPDKRDGMLARLFMKRGIEVFGNTGSLENEDYGKKLVEKFEHNIPTSLFLALPFLAMVLKLLYIRRKHPWYYVDHVVFLLHVFMASFLIVLAYYGFLGLYKWTGWRAMRWIGEIVYWYTVVYSFLAMYFFYRQGFWKTLLKFLLFISIGGLITVLVFLVMLGVAFFTV